MVSGTRAPPLSAAPGWVALALASTMALAERESPLWMSSEVEREALDSEAALEATRLATMRQALRQAVEGSGQCNFDQGHWREYVEAPHNGVIFFDGDQRGQGIGEILGGLGRAVQLALLTKRDLKMKIHVGGKLLEKVVEVNLHSGSDGGPQKQGKEPETEKEAKAETTYPKCSYWAAQFDFGGSSRLEDMMAAAKDVSKFPTFCLSANFGNDNFKDRLIKDLNIEPTSMDSKLGCALDFVLDTSKFKRPTADTFQLVGHLRLGDSFLGGYGDARDVVTRTFRGPQAAGVGFLDCMQGVAERFMKQEGRAGSKCQLVLVSDSQIAKHAAKERSAAAAAQEGQCEVIIDETFKPMHSVRSGFSDEQAEQTIRDMFLLANADAALVTHSGFGYAGADMGPVLEDKAFRVTDILQSNEKGREAWRTDVTKACREAEAPALSSTHLGYFG